MSKKIIGAQRDLVKYAHEYGHLAFEDIQEDARRIEIVKALETFSWNSIIEVGCGNMSILAKIKNYENAAIIEPITDFLQKNFLEFNFDSRVTGFNGTLSQYASTFDEKWDICLLSSLLHEVEDQKGMLDDCRKILKPNGTLIVNVPNAYSIHRILAVNKGLIKNVFEISETQKLMQQGLAPFSNQSLSELLCENGFTISKMYTIIPKLLDHNNLSRLLNSGKISMDFLRQINELSGEIEPFGSEILVLAHKATE
jgi:SAM-dependent methyltransferase